jgi:hypothetical protein
MASVLTTADTYSSFVKTRLLTQLWMPKKLCPFVNLTQWFAREFPVILIHRNSFVTHYLSQFQSEECHSLMQKQLSMNKKKTLLTALMEEPTSEKSTLSSCVSLLWLRNQSKNLMQIKIKKNWRMCLINLFRLLMLIMAGFQALLGNLCLQHWNKLNVSIEDISGPVDF